MREKSSRYRVWIRTVLTVVSGWILARTDGEYPSLFPSPHTILRKVQISHMTNLYTSMVLSLGYSETTRNVFKKLIWSGRVKGCKYACYILPENSFYLGKFRETNDIVAFDVVKLAKTTTCS